MIVLGKNTDDKGKQLEAITHNLLSSKGYINITTNFISTGGHEIDVVADYIYPTIGGTDSRRIICECKAHKKPIAIDDWLKFIGKLFCEQEELNTEITGYFIALSGVNGNVSGNYDKLKLKRKNIILIAGNTLLDELKSLYSLISEKDLSDKILSLTNNNIEKIEVAYYKKKIYNVVIFERKGLFTVLDNQGNVLEDGERKEISSMVKKELKLKEFFNLDDEIKAQRRINLTKKAILGAIINNSGKIQKDSVATLNTIQQLKLTLVEIEEAIQSLIENKIASISDSGKEIRIPKKSKELCSILTKIYKVLLAGEPTVETVEAIKSNYYLASINEQLVSEIQKIQGGLSLSKEDIKKTIKLFKWFPSSLAWMLEPDEGFINANKQKETVDKAELDIESIIRNDFFQKIISIGLNDLRYEFPRIYLKEVHGIDTFSTARKIIFKKDSKIEETISINEMKKIAVLADDWVGPDGSKYIMTLGPYSEDLEMMPTLTIEISEKFNEQFSAVAKRSKLSKEKLATKALQEFIERQTNNVLSKQTVADLAGHLFGTIDVDAPSDVSTNKKYLEGFGE